MSVERPDFLQAYEAVEVPKPLNLERAREGEARETVEHFFETIETSLDLSQRSLANLFEYSTVEAGLSYQKTFQRMGGQAIASVLYVHRAQRERLFFSKARLEEPTIDDIRAFQLFERLESGIE